MLTLYGGSKTLTQQDNRSLTVYTLRWEGYNYGGSSTVKTIVEFNFYADTETYEGYAKLICSSDGDYRKISSIQDILYFLTQKKFHQKFNWF